MDAGVVSGVLQIAMNAMKRSRRSPASRLTTAPRSRETFELTGEKAGEMLLFDLSWTRCGRSLDSEGRNFVGLL